MKEKSEKLNQIFLDDTTVVIWWNGWIWGEVIKILNKNNKKYISIWSRTQPTDINKGFIGWDIYDKNSEAYKVIMKQICNSQSAINIILNAGFNMDKTPKEINWKTYRDAINPKTWEIWEDIMNQNIQITNKEKNKIRREITESQINFYKDFFKNLSERESNKNINVVFSNWTIAKYKESLFLKDSMYWYSKQETTKIITKLFWKLKDKNVNVKDIYLALVETDMLKIDLLDQTAKLAKILSPYFPLDWKEMEQKDLLDPKDIANFLCEILNKKADEIPDQIAVVSKDDLNVSEIQKQFKIQKPKMIEFIKLKNLKKEGDFFILDETLISFLLELRKVWLDVYYEKNKHNIVKKDNLYKTLGVFESNLKTLDKKINFEHLLYLCFKAENNYP